jgi:signal transduction histidine kinase
VATAAYSLHKASPAPFQQERETLGSDIRNSLCIDLHASRAASQDVSRKGRREMPWLRRVRTAFLAIGGGLLRLRVHSFVRESNARAEGRSDERLRVARELHDTLLQTFQASLVQMQVARNLLSRGHGDAAQNLDHAIKLAADGIAEGRAAIHGLRCQAADQGNLEEMLSVAGQELAACPEGERPVRFRVIVEGRRRQLKAPVQEVVYQVARELLRNAFRHARASQVEAEIRYAWRLLGVHVRDNGVGIDLEVLKAGGSAGHWGLAGVRERTKGIGGRLDFWSKTGVGTEVKLTVPAVIAYAAAERAAGSSSFINRFIRR